MILLKKRKLLDLNLLLCPQILKRNKYGGIHGICVFIKERIPHHCTIIDNFVSESVLWKHFNTHISGFSFILGAVYLPHEASDYHHEDIYEFLADHIITIKATLMFQSYC